MKLIQYGDIVIFENTKYEVVNIIGNTIYALNLDRTQLYELPLDKVVKRKRTEEQKYISKLETENLILKKDWRAIKLQIPDMYKKKMKEMEKDYIDYKQLDW